MMVGDDDASFLFIDCGLVVEVVWETIPLKSETPIGHTNQPAESMLTYNGD